MKRTRHFLLALLTMSLFYNCENSSSSQRILASSSGNINSLSVVIDNELWDGSVGDSIRSILGAPVYGLPQEEPLFSIRQMPTIVFSDFAKRNRTVLKIEKGKAAGMKIVDDAFARPQKLVLVTGMTNPEINQVLSENADKIISEFKSTEIKEKQKRMRKSLSKNTGIEEKLGLQIQYPTIYRVAKEDEGFFWVRKDTETGSVNLLLYELPLDRVSTENPINDVIAVRDSIGQQYIPGPMEGTFMITEMAYTPFSEAIILDNKPAQLTKSTWEVKDAFMGGPFINYVIRDEINKRLIVAEGFVYAPSVGKRDYVFELEAIIQTLHIL